MSNLQAIKELRERTQAGMSDCKNALQESEGDMEKAVEIILKKGLAKSAKRAGAVATEGEVRASVTADKKSGAIVEVNTQTDFTARNEAFTDYVGEVLKAAETTELGGDIANAKIDGGKTVGEKAAELTGKIGEKIACRRWTRIAVPGGEEGLVQSYVHLGGKIGVLLRLKAGSKAVAEHAATAQLAEDTAMHICAAAPLVLKREDVTDEMVAKQKEIYTAQLAEDPKPKPEAAWPKIIEGKLNKWYSEIALLDQESVVTAGSKITALVAEAAKAAGGELTIAEFVRYERGEGIEKKEDNFADEVAKMAGG